MYSAREPLNATEESSDSDSSVSSEEEVQPLRKKKQSKKKQSAAKKKTQNQLQIVLVVDAEETVVRSSKGTGRKKGKDNIVKGTEWTMKEIVGAVLMQDIVTLMRSPGLTPTPCMKTKQVVMKKWLG